MLLNLSNQSSETLQAQIVRQIRAHILSGNMVPGDELPSIRALASDQRVSVITIQRAYESLERENLIQVRRGRGFLVKELEPGERRSLALLQLNRQLGPAIEQALAEGLTVDDVVSQVRSLATGVRL